MVKGDYIAERGERRLVPAVSAYLHRRAAVAEANAPASQINAVDTPRVDYFIICNIQARDIVGAEYIVFAVYEAVGVDGYIRKRRVLRPAARDICLYSDGGIPAAVSAELELVVTDNKIVDSRALVPETGHDVHDYFYLLTHYFIESVVLAESVVALEQQSACAVLVEIVV